MTLPTAFQRSNGPTNTYTNSRGNTVPTPSDTPTNRRFPTPYNPRALESAQRGLVGRWRFLRQQGQAEQDPRNIAFTANQHHPPHWLLAVLRGGGGEVPDQPLPRTPLWTAPIQFLGAAGIFGRSTSDDRKTACSRIRWRTGFGIAGETCTTKRQPKNGVTHNDHRGMRRLRIEL